MNLATMYSDSVSSYFGFLLSGFCFSRMPLVPTYCLRDCVWYYIWPCVYSFLTVVQHLAPNAYIYLVWVLALDCVWTPEWFVLWMWFLFWKYTFSRMAPLAHQWTTMKSIVLASVLDFKHLTQVSRLLLLGSYFMRGFWQEIDWSEEEIHRSQTIDGSILYMS